MPQTIIIDVSQLKLYPKKGFNSFGIYCWHAYNTNPKLIEILISDNYNNNSKNSNFSSLGIFELELRDGIQLFPIDYNVLDDTSIKNKIKAFKIIIKSTYGSDKTYINQIMFYENTAQEIKSENNNNESFQNDINLPGDLSNSQISNEDKEKEKQEIQMENKDNYKNTQNIKRNSNITNNSNKQYIIDYISETHSNNNTEMNENNNYNIEKNESIRDDIKVEENNDIHDNSDDDNNEEENENNDEANKIIATSDELEYPYENKYDRNISKNNNPLNQNQNKNLNIPNKNNTKSNKVQKLEKILKENILNNGFNKKYNNEIYINNSFRNQTEYNNPKMDYINHLTINNYPSLMQFKNDYIIKNNPNLNNISTRNIQDNNIQKYFKLNAQTPKHLTVKGYDNLLNKRRPYTPKLNEINRNSISAQYNVNEFKNQTTMAGFNKINDNIGNREYETLEIQLQDMEQHLKNMALDNEMLSKINYNSRTNREYNIKNLNKNNYFNDEMQINNNYIDKKSKNISMISNRSSFIVDQQKNINANNSNINCNSQNNNYFNHYKTEYKNNSINNINNEEEYGINKRIDDLEKNMLEIKDELSNISSNLKIFMNKDNFLYNFKDSIKQICYDFFTERINNNSDNNNHENINNNEFYNKEQIQNENNNEENENNSQYSEDYSENKNVQNEKMKIENEINQKIDEKLEYLCDNLQNQIFEKYLKPSINEIEKSMRENIEDIKEKVESINHTNITNNSYIKNKYNNLMDNEENINYNNDYDTYSIINKNNEQNSKGDIYHKTSSRIKKEKYEEINRLGEKLYSKLLEKEKKLKLLNQETNLLISKKHLGNNSFED